jgi:hypothetical protein
MYVQWSLHPGFGVNVTGGYCDVRGALVSIFVENRAVSRLCPVCGAAVNVAVALGEAGSGSGALVKTLERLDTISNHITEFFSRMLIWETIAGKGRTKHRKEVYEEYRRALNRQILLYFGGL